MYMVRKEINERFVSFLSAIHGDLGSLELDRPGFEACWATVATACPGVQYSATELMHISGKQTIALMTFTG